jgi:hypothetical protein
MLVIVTGIDVVDAAELVVIVVTPPDAVADLKSAGFVWPYWRIVIALLEVAIASEASATRARVRNETAFMEPLLKCCRIGMLPNLIERGHRIVVACNFNQNLGILLVST